MLHLINYKAIADAKQATYDDVLCKFIFKYNIFIMVIINNFSGYKNHSILN